MSEKGKKSKILKTIPPIIKHPYAVIIFLIIILTVTILSINFQFFGGKLPLGSSETKIESNYSDTVATWGQTTGISYSASITYPPGTCLTPALNKKLNDTQDPRLYVYDNPIGIFKKPDINTVFDDMLSGLAYQSPESLNPVCYQPDEIYASYQTRTCQSKTRKCLSSFGNQINFGVSEKFALKGDLPPCGDFMGAISFNFHLNQGGFLSQNTKFLNVDLVECTQKGFDDINSNYPYYVQTGLFTPLVNNDLALADDEYLPSFSNQAYQGDIPNQKFIIRRYSWGASNSEWIPDQYGAFGSIILKAGNLYLTAKAYNNGITGLTDIKTTTTGASLSGIYRLFQGENKTGSIGLSINSVGESEYSIISSGRDYTLGGISITSLNDTSQVVANATVNRLLNDYVLILKPVDGVSTIDETVNWMFMPNIDFNPAKIPSKNKLGSDMGSIDNLALINPGTYIGSVNRYSQFGSWVRANFSSESGVMFDISLPCPQVTNGDMNTFNVNIEWPNNQRSVNKDEVFVQLDNIETGEINSRVANGLDTAGRNDEGVENYWETIDEKQIKFYPKFKYKALVNGICDENIEFSRGFQLTGQGTPQWRFNQYSDFDIKDILDVNFSMFLPNYDQVGEIIQDGEVEWLVQDASEDVCVFDNDYFNQPAIGPGIKKATLTYGGASWSDGGAKKSIYRPPTTGLISSLNLNNINYTPSDLKELGTTVVDLEVGVSVPGLTQGTGAKIIFYIVPALDDGGNDVGNIESYQILETGRNYTNDTITVFLGGINGPSIQNISLTTKSIVPTFEAVAVLAFANDTINYSNLGGKNTIDNTTENISYGACFSGLKISPDGTQLLANNLQVEVPGFNYYVDKTVYINQIYQGESYIYVPGDNTEGIPPSVSNDGSFEDSWNPFSFQDDNLKYLAQLRVTETIDQVDLASNPAPYNLNRTNFSGPGYSMIYNFLNIPSNKGIYSPSPQQIAFLEPGIKENFRDNLGTNDPENYLNIFKGPDVFTNLNTLKTLQFLELNYTAADSSDPTKIITTIDEQNQLDPTAQLKLGRFIPYSVFSNPTFKDGDIEIPNGDPNELYFNNNNTNIIAYGQKSIINIPIKQSMLDTF